MNDTDVASKLEDNECVLALNAEFFFSLLGERRQGCEPLAMTSSGLTDKAVIVHLSQFFANNTVTTPELWAVGATANTAISAAHRVAGTWSAVTIPDTPVTTEPEIYQWTAQALDGKYFFAYRSAVDRLHVWDGTNFRRTGLAQPAAPVVTNNAGGGTYATVRYFRVRYLEKSGSTVLRRSEPSATTTFTPSGTNAGADIAKPAAISENETHWEVEASADNANFYVIATPAVGTASYTDTTASPLNYATNGVLSEAIGSYVLQKSARYLSKDGDLLLMAGHFTDVTLDSTLWWSTARADPGAGNNERQPIVTTGGVAITTSINLDNYAGGRITGLSQVANSAFIVFKWSHVYKVSRTQNVVKAYEALPISTERGALPGSVVAGADENGRACIYFLDPVFGLSRYGAMGMQSIRGLRTTWRKANLLATKVICHGVYYPDKHQVHWWVSMDGSDSPNYKIVLQVNELRITEEGARGGISVADGRITEAYCSTIFNELVTGDPSAAVTLRARPFIGLTTPDYVQRCDVVTTDAGQTYRARIRSGPKLVVGLLNKWGAMVAALLASANALRVKVQLIRDFGLESKSVTTDLLNTSTEPFVIKTFDDLNMSEAHSIQIEFSDPD